MMHHQTKVVTYQHAYVTVAPELLDAADKALAEGRLSWRVTNKEGRACNGGQAGPLALGEWSRTIAPKCCQAGWHTTTTPHRYRGQRVWLVEGAGARDECGDKTAWERVRPLAEVDPSLCADAQIFIRCAPTLRGADLRNADLKGADLWGADLWGADLRSAKLWSANLSYANLSYANLRRANLRRANLRRANLRGATLRGADLRDATLHDADLRSANLRAVDLRGATGRDDWANLEALGAIR